jgi:hypothetical protein
MIFPLLTGEISIEDFATPLSALVILYNREISLDISVLLPIVYGGFAWHQKARRRP